MPKIEKKINHINNNNNRETNVLFIRKLTEEEEFMSNNYIVYLSKLKYVCYIPHNQQQKEQVQQKTTPKYILRSKKKAIALLHEFSYNLLSQISWENTAIIGGSLSIVLLKYLNPNYFRTSDIDIFVWGPTQKYIKKRIIQLIQQIMLQVKDPNNVLIFQNDTVITLCFRGIYRNIQIVNSRMTSLEAILNQTDFVSCQIAFDGTNFIASCHCLLSYIHRCTWSRKLFISAARLYKALQRDFSVIFHQSQHILVYKNNGPCYKSNDHMEKDIYNIVCYHDKKHHMILLSDMKANSCKYYYPTLHETTDEIKKNIQERLHKEYKLRTLNQLYKKLQEENEMNIRMITKAIHDKIFFYDHDYDSEINGNEICNGCGRQGCCILSARDRLEVYSIITVPYTKYKIIKDKLSNNCVIVDRLTKEQNLLIQKLINDRCNNIYTIDSKNHVMLSFDSTVHNKLNQLFITNNLLQYVPIDNINSVFGPCLKRHKKIQANFSVCIKLSTESAELSTESVELSTESVELSTEHRKLKYGTIYKLKFSFMECWCENVEIVHIN